MCRELLAVIGLTSEPLITLIVSATARETFEGDRVTGLIIEAVKMLGTFRTTDEVLSVTELISSTAPLYISITPGDTGPSEATLLVRAVTVEEATLNTAAVRVTVSAGSTGVAVFTHLNAAYASVEVTEETSITLSDPAAWSATRVDGIAIGAGISAVLIYLTGRPARVRVTAQRAPHSVERFSPSIAAAHR